MWNFQVQNQYQKYQPNVENQVSEDMHRSLNYYKEIPVMFMGLGIAIIVAYKLMNRALSGNEKCLTSGNFSLL